MTMRESWLPFEMPVERRSSRAERARSLQARVAERVGAPRAARERRVVVRRDARESVDQQFFAERTQRDFRADAFERGGQPPAGGLGYFGGRDERRERRHRRARD